MRFPFAKIRCLELTPRESANYGPHALVGAIEVPNELLRSPNHFRLWGFLQPPQFPCCFQTHLAHLDYRKDALPLRHLMDWSVRKCAHCSVQSIGIVLAHDVVHETDRLRIGRRVAGHFQLPIHVLHEARDPAYPVLSLVQIVVRSSLKRLSRLKNGQCDSRQDRSYRPDSLDPRGIVACFSWSWRSKDQCQCDERGDDNHQPKELRKAFHKQDAATATVH